MEEKSAEQELEEELVLVSTRNALLDCDSSTAENSTLARAAWEGRLLEVRQLLKDRADPNIFEAHVGGSSRLTPLMAAAAGSRVDVVAELLVAGADPDLPSPAGVVAGDLAENDRKGQKIMKLLAAFRTEIEDELGGGASPGADGPSSLVIARREAVARISKRGLAIVEKALLGVAKLSAACSPDGGDDEDKDVMLAGDAALGGEEARKARKARQQDKECSRLQRVAERAAARRGVDVEEERLRRVAEKAAARRARDPQDAEQIRMERVNEKAAARRNKAALEEEAKQKKEEARLQRLAEKSSDRASARQMRSELVNKLQDEQDEQDEQRRQMKPVLKRKVVETDVLMCASCGQSSQRLECGVCKHMGMCAVCSKCFICGRASGFASKVAKTFIPGMISSF